MRILAFLAVTCALQGCAGAMGGTKPFVLEIEPVADAELRRVVLVASVGIADGANEVDSVGTYHVGKIGEGELADLRRSMTDTLSGIDWPSAPADSPLAVHLLVSHYYVAHSNNDGGVLAGIDWALVSDPTDIVFSERFFASIQASDLEGINTLGKAKNTLNAQIVRRVVETSLEFAADSGRVPHADVAHTYDTAAEAAAPMPGRLTSFMGLPSFSTKQVDWAAGAPAEPVDWESILVK